MLRRSHILTTAALLAVCATPASAAPYEDLRSPDAVDAAEHRGLYAERPSESPFPGLSAQAQRAAPGPYVLNRDDGSPDAVEAARDLPPVQVPAPVVAAGDPSGGFDWGDAGIGAAGALALFSIAGGSALMLSERRRRRAVGVATH